jgi:hypothetical protein
MKMLLPLLLLFSLRVEAIPLTTIEVDGNLWLQPIDFLGFTWDEIQAVCDPVCDGALGGQDLTGWTWAETDALNALFNHYIGSSEMGPGPDQYVVEDSLALGFEFLADGWEPTLFDITNLIQVAVGYISDTPDRVALVGGGYTRTGGVSATQTDFTSSFYTPQETGAWFTRVGVPLPATPVLIALAFLGLVQVRRSR